MKSINYGVRARIGMLLPSSNQAAEPLLHSLLPEGVSLHTTRLQLTGSSEQALMAMTEKIEEAASLVADAAVNLIVFHCTAVSTFDLKLEQSIRQRIEKTTATKTVLTSDAIVAGLRKLGAKKIVMLSPYTESTNEREKSFFEAYGFEVLGCAGLGRTTAPEMMSITPLQWIDFALANRNDDVDAYLISCTTVKSSETAGHLEELLGKPVVTSNTAMIWFCLRELGITDSIPSFGSLLLSH